MSEIQKGYCQCGCGNKTNIAKCTDKNKKMVKGEPRNSIHGHNRKGMGNKNWTKYPTVKCKNHPHANSSGFVHEHTIVMEKSLGRLLSRPESVHHRDGNPNNNDIGNLILFATHGMHSRYHIALNAFNESGNWNWRKCQFCKKYDDPKNLYIGPKNVHVYHSNCINEYNRKRRIILFDEEV